MKLLQKFFFLLVSQLVVLLMFIQILDISILSMLNKAVFFNNSIEYKYFNSIFTYFVKRNIFLADIGVLEKIENSRENSSFQTLPNHVTFCVHERNLEKVLMDILNQNFDCKVILANGTFFSRSVITNIFLKCKYFLEFQIAVAYKRNKYVWLGDNIKLHNLKPKWFGDLQRLMSETNEMRNFEINYYNMLIPLNIKRFLYDYKHSTMRNCNSSLVHLNNKLSNGTYKQDNQRNKKMLAGLRYIVSAFESMLKPYWLGKNELD